MSTQVPEDDRPLADDSGYLPEPVLPEPVRQRVISLAAAALTGLAGDELPQALRRVAKFAPNRRAKLGGTAIATQLSGDPLFRQRVTGQLCGDRGAGQPGPAVGRELGHPPQRYRQLVTGQPGQRGGRQRDHPLADRLRENRLRQTRRVVRRGAGFVGRLL